MKVTVTLDVEPLPKDRLLAFYESIATAGFGERTFEITRSLTGMTFGLYEEVDGITVVHTLNIQPAIQAALESIVGGVVEEPPHGSIVLIHGATGTAFQRYFRDGLWHADGHEPQTWEQLTLHSLARRVMVVYTAPVQEDGE